MFEVETGFNPIVEGIKKIGVGKHGSDSCSEELSGQIFSEYKMESLSLFKMLFFFLLYFLKNHL
ncbi:MAG: hypothetical protein IPK68_11755 [Bdellovibrionales bacterium]|nr:hypothetical protein [Bdellovibrionales bacterium]